MKPLKKLLAGSLIAGSILLYSGTSKGEDPQKEIYSPKKIERVYEEYSKLFEKAKDYDTITHEEIQELYNFLETHLPHMSKDTFVIKNPNSKVDFKEIVTNLENKVLKYFPGLVKKGDTGIIYNADKELSKEHNNSLKGLISKANELYQQNENKDLEPLTKKEELTIQDLLTFYLILNGNPINISENIKFSLNNLIGHKEAYSTFLNEVKKWRKTRPKYFSAGVTPFVFLKGEGTNDAKKMNRKPQPKGIHDNKLEDIFNCKINNVKNEFPIETLIHPILGIILGAIPPLFIKWRIMKYTKRRYDNVNFDADDAEVILSSFGSIIVDAVHPLAMPIRLFALPVVTEFIKKFKK